MNRRAFFTALSGRRDSHPRPPWGQAVLRYTVPKWICGCLPRSCPQTGQDPPLLLTSITRPLSDICAFIRFPRRVRLACRRSNSLAPAPPTRTQTHQTDTREGEGGRLRHLRQRKRRSADDRLPFLRVLLTTVRCKEHADPDQSGVPIGSDACGATGIWAPRLAKVIDIRLPESGRLASSARAMG